MVLVLLDAGMSKNENIFISISLHKTHALVDKSPQRKFKYTEPQYPAIPLSDIFSRMLNHAKGHLLNYVHSRIICNSQNLEMTYMFFNKELDKKMWYIYTMESAFNSTVKNNKTIKFKGK